MRLTVAWLIRLSSCSNVLSRGVGYAWLTTWVLVAGAQEAIDVLASVVSFGSMYKVVALAFAMLVGTASASFDGLPRKLLA